jgi:hypothetical protein
MANFRLLATRTPRIALLAQLLAAAGFILYSLATNGDSFRTAIGSGNLKMKPLGSGEGVPPSPSSLSEHHLRLDWTNISALSPMARYWRSHQRRCDWPLADFRFRNKFGMGSDLHTWTQALCNGAELRVRMRTQVPWTFLDEFSCFGSVHGDDTKPVRSAMDCYFPKAEPACPDDHDDDNGVSSAYSDRTKLYRDNEIVAKKCTSLMKKHHLNYSDVRASAIEYLFSPVSPLVVQEAERQLKALFGGEGKSRPARLVTVHIRWGDKNDQIDPMPIEAYVRAVQELLKSSAEKGEGVALSRNGAGSESVGIYLSTEDPLAVSQFQDEAAKHNWTVFVDMYYQTFTSDRLAGSNGNPRMAKKLQGRPGLVALASLLVALQSNDFVLTTISNWSRLINELRKTVLDPRCNDCTRMIDLTNFTFEW